MDTPSGVVGALVDQINVLDDTLDTLANNFNEEVAHLRLLIADLSREVQA